MFELWSSTLAPLHLRYLFYPISLVHPHFVRISLKGCIRWLLESRRKTRWNNHCSTLLTSSIRGFLRRSKRWLRRAFRFHLKIWVVRNLFNGSDHQRIAIQLSTIALNFVMWWTCKLLLAKFSSGTLNLSTAVKQRNALASLGFFVNKSGDRSVQIWSVTGCFGCWKTV